MEQKLDQQEDEYPYIKMNKDFKRLAARIKEKINNDDTDCLLIFSGDTGSGKSVAAMQFGYMVDNSISIDRICFDKKEFIDAVVNAKKGQAVVADEAVSMLMSRAAMTKDSRLIVELMNQIRQKNLLIIMNIPDVTLLDKTMQEKAMAHVHVYEGRENWGKNKVTVKGNLELFMDLPGGPHLKTRLYLHLRAIKTNPNSKHKRPTPLLRSRGQGMGESYDPPFYPVSESLYRQKKESVLKKYMEGDKEKEKKKSVNPMTLKAMEKFPQTVKNMRLAGFSYRKIREFTGLSYDGIKSYCGDAEKMKTSIENTISPVIPNL